MTPLSPADVAARSTALIVFRGDLSTLVVTGPDRREWLEGVLTCDVQGLAPGVGRWSLALTKPGKIVADVLVVETGGEAYLAVPGVARERLHAALAGFLVMEDADIAGAPDQSWITVHGPDAPRVAAALAVAAGGHSATLELTGLGDAAVVLPAAAVGAARERAAALAAQGEAVVAAEEDWERLRLERGVPVFGRDVFETTSPHEASLERRCVSWEKGCYLGQEAVCMQEMRGKVKRRTALLRVESDTPPEPGTEVRDTAGALLGETRSAAASAVHAGPIALAVIAAGAAAPGTVVSVGGRVATVVAPDR